METQAGAKRDSTSSRGTIGASRGSIGSRPLGSAASSIVANTGTPRASPPPAGPAIPGVTSHRNSDASSSSTYHGRGRPSLMKDFDVGVFNGAEASKIWAAPKADERRASSPKQSIVSSKSSDGDGAESDVSAGSHISIKALKRSMTENNKCAIKGESTTVRLHLDDCIVEAEKEPTAGRWKQSALTDFRLLCGTGHHRDGLMKGLEMYGLKTPNRCQEHLLPVLLYFLGRHLEGIPDEKGSVRSCISVQGPQSGKTTSAVLASLSVIDTAVQQPQAILVSRSPKLAINKFVRVLAMTNSFSYQAFDADETGLDLDIDPGSPEVIAARTAHVLVGDPGRLLKALTSGADIPLEAVKIFVVDDAHVLFFGSSPVSSPSPSVEPLSPKSDKSSLRLSGLPSGEKTAEVKGDGMGNASAAAEKGAAATSAIEDVVEICKLLDASKAVKIPYLIIAEESTDKASKKMMRMLKSSMSIKKNLLGVESCTAPMKLIKAMKHYYAEAPSADWVRIFAGLVQALTFPRALIYCDDDRIHSYLKEMQTMGIAVSANLPGATAESRRCALGDFSANKTQFLLTHSEPAVCQIMLPKVSCVFHFGILSQLPSVYGVRLSPLDEKLKKESASILLVDPDARDAKASSSSKDAKAADLHPTVSKLQKVFSISFMDMPLEMLPNRQTGRKMTAQ